MTSEHDWVNNLKVAELKDELKQRRLPTSGTKAVLQERLLAFLKSEESRKRAEAEQASDQPDETDNDNVDPAAETVRGAADDKEPSAAVAEDSATEKPSVETTEKASVETSEKPSVASPPAGSKEDKAAETQSGRKVAEADPEDDSTAAPKPAAGEKPDADKDNSSKPDVDETEKPSASKSDADKTEQPSAAGEESNEVDERAKKATDAEDDAAADEAAPMDTDAGEASPSPKEDAPSSPSNKDASPGESSEPSSSKSAKPNGTSSDTPANPTSKSSEQANDDEQQNEEVEQLDYEDDVDMDADKAEAPSNGAEAATPHTNEATPHTNQNTTTTQKKSEESEKNKSEESEQNTETKLVEAPNEVDTKDSKDSNEATPAPLHKATSADAPKTDAATTEGRKRRNFIPIPKFDPPPKNAAKSKPATPVHDTPAPKQISAPPEKQQKPEAPVAAAETETTVSSSPGPSAVRVDGFVRPLREPDVRQLMEKYGTVVDLWMPTIKTHCYVIYSEGGSADAVVKDLMDKDWQGLGNRLNPKVISVTTAEQSISIGRSGGTRRPTPTTTPAARAAVAKSVEATTPKVAPVFVPKDGAVSKEDVEVSRAEVAPKPSLAPIRTTPREEPKAMTLEDLFRRTTTKPRIYWLPVTDAEVAARRAARAAGGTGGVEVEGGAGKHSGGEANGVHTMGAGEVARERDGEKGRVERSSPVEKGSNGLERGRRDEREGKRSAREEGDRRDERDSKRVRRDEDERREPMSRGRRDDSDRRGRR